MHIRILHISLILSFAILLLFQQSTQWIDAAGYPQAALSVLLPKSVALAGAVNQSEPPVTQNSLIFMPMVSQPRVIATPTSTPGNRQSPAGPCISIAGDLICNNSIPTTSRARISSAMPLPANAPTSTLTNTAPIIPAPIIPAPGQAPFAAVIPSGGTAGTFVAVTGGGFPADAFVNIHLAKLGQEIGGDAMTYATVRADATGDFNALITFPAVWPDGTDIETSRILILAAMAELEIQVSAFFDYQKPVVPTATPTPVPPTATPTPVPPTATPIPIPLPISSSGWSASYWDNDSLDGEPVIERNDSDIYFRWEAGSPDSGIPADNFSARWTRQIAFAAGTYRFNAIADDGLRIWINEIPIIDEWQDSGTATYSTDVKLNAGIHNVRVEYYENLLDAHIRVWWDEHVVSPRPTSTPITLETPVSTPASTLTPTPLWTPVAGVSCDVTRTFTVAINTGRDDAEQRSDGTVKHDSDELEMALHDSGNQTVGLRFQGVSLPRGAEIVSAYIDFTAETVSHQATTLTFHGEATDNAARYERDRFNISGRNHTSASATWSNVPAWSRIGQVSHSPNLALLVQAIVDRGGWRTGNAMSFMVYGEGLRIAETYDSNPNAAARLTVEFR